MATLFETRREDDSYALLNPSQRRAVQHGEGPLLVVAGAGTGKTRVITERIRHLLESEPGLGGEHILGLTFTDKAAGEMKSRVVAATGERGKGVQLSTFHSFCKELLSELDPERRLLEKVDHWILLRRNMHRLQLERYRRLAEPGQFLGDFVEFFSRCQDELVSSEEYRRYADSLVERLERDRATLDEDTLRERGEEAARQREIARAYRASEELLRETKRMTFGGLIAETVRKLDEDAALRTALQQRFRYILVDEFQDTNIAQLELLWLLAGHHRNIVVVGDNDQAIYRFRGASFGSFTIFLEKFAGCREGSAELERFRVSLTENYRSTGRILRIAGQVIAQNELSPLFPKKELVPRKDEGEKARIVELGSAEEEARWVTGEIERLHSAGHLWHDFAVLYRMHAHRDALVDELARRRIPFLIKNLSILGNRLVRDVVAYLRVVAHPSDDIACARVLAAPAWGLTAADLLRLIERSRKNRGASLWDALKEPQGELRFSGDGQKTEELVSFVTGLRKTLRRRGTSEILDELLEWLEAHQRASATDRKYLLRLAEFVREWEQKYEDRSLPAFVEYLEYFEPAGGQINLEEDPPGDAVKLMTVHAAKGLEFNHIFILRLNKGGFPANARPRVLEFPEALMKEEKPEGDFHIQEERRLFYVAVTRARERLTLTSVVHERSKPSVFLDDILMEPAIKRRDVQQLAPKVPSAAACAPPEPAASPTLFPASSKAPRILSRATEWADGFQPPAPEPLSLSASAIETYRSCPKKYLFHQIWGLQEGPRAAMSFGSVMHTTIKHFIGTLRKGTLLPFEELAAIFEREWTPAGFEDEYQETEYKKDGLEQLRAFHARIAAQPPEVREQEKSFDLPMANNVVLIGRMDQINSLGRREAEIVDYKTGRPKTDAAARKDLQLSIYALAAREVLEVEPVRLVFHYLQNDQLQVTSRDTKQLKEAEEIVQEVAADIRAGEFPARPAFLCRSCGFRPLCPAHEETESPAPRGG